MLLLVAFFVDLLTVLSVLSLCFQKEDIDPVASTRALTKTKERLSLIKKKEFEKLPNVRHLLSKITQEDGSDDVFYQHVKLSPSFEHTKVSLASQKNSYVDKVQECLFERLESEEESKDLFRSLPLILDCEGWPENDTEFADDEILKLCGQFETPLKAAGISCSVPDILYQWHKLVEFAVKTVGVTGKSYLAT